VCLISYGIVDLTEMTVWRAASASLWGDGQEKGKKKASDGIMTEKTLTYLTVLTHTQHTHKTTPQAIFLSVPLRRPLNKCKNEDHCPPLS
jgi:hypothetical protein